MNIVKKTITTTRKFVSDHKVGIAFTTGATIGLVLNRVALKDHDEFLKAHGLYDAFYTPVD